MLTEEIDLHFLERKIKIYYVISQNKRVRLIERPGHEWILLGHKFDKTICKKLLALKIKQIAEEHLKRELTSHANKMNLNYHQVTLRAQRSRWGSCSSDKKISLNYLLIFLPKALANYVMIHELAHLMHFNHSPAFWQLVSEHDKNWKENKKSLKSFERWIPSWIVG